MTPFYPLGEWSGRKRGRRGILVPPLGNRPGIGQNGRFCGCTKLPGQEACAASAQTMTQNIRFLTFP